MRIDKKIDATIATVVMLVSTIISFYIAYNTTHDGYKNLFILPFLYGLVYVIFISPIRRKLNNIYIHVFIAVSLTRYVLLPLLLTITNHYGGGSSLPPMDNSFQKAIYLMSYEMIIVSFFTYLLFRNIKLKEINHQEVKLPKTMLVYSIFIILSVFLGFIFPESLKSFAILKVSDNYIGIGRESMGERLTIYSLVISKYLVFILVLNFLYKKFNSEKKSLYVFISFLVVMINFAVFFGDNRADYIITGIASILLFARLYPSYLKKTLIPMLLFLMLLTYQISEYRDNGTATGGENQLIDLTNTLQVYLAGPYNVAISIEAAEINQNEIKPHNIIHELLRPVIGLNIFLKNYDIKSSSAYFNERITFGKYYSQIVPMIGQGYFYLGFLLSPAITIFYIWLVKKLILIRQNQNRIELIFFLTIPIARIGFAIAQNGAILANDISFFLVLSMIIYFLNNKIKIVNSRNTNVPHYSIGK